MAGQTDFKHITVNPSDADDVVIQAGIADASAVEHGEAASCPSPSAPQASHEPMPAPDAASRPREDAYRETTLDDIKGSKMPKTQIIVIALAVVAIAAFVIWNIAVS